MTYFEALEMKMEFEVALEYMGITPKQYIEVAKKYSAKQWLECSKALLDKIEADKTHVFEMIMLIEKIRKIEDKQ